jgi:osmotically-inducible protein OsmY
MQADASRGMDQAKQAGRDMAQDAKSATDKAGDKVADAVITTSVNAELAKDSSLSALKINVDTANGRVALRGTAPSEAARERATQLASNVKGVVSVDNQLSVEPAKG